MARSSTRNRRVKSNEIVITHSPQFPWQKRVDETLNREGLRFMLIVLGRRSGKTEKLSRLAGKRALRGKTVFWGAPTFDTSKIGFARFVERWRPIITRKTEMPPHCDVLGGGVVDWRSFDRPGAALGRGNDLVVIDEAARVKKQVLYEEVVPTVGDTGGTLVAITTPRGKLHWTYEWYLRAKDGDPRYGLVHGPSTENPMPAIKDFVEIARDNMPESLFKQEIMAEFLEGEGLVFRNVHACATVPGYRDAPEMHTKVLNWFDADEPEIVGERSARTRTKNPIVIGGDLAKHQDYTVLYAMDVETGEVLGKLRINQLDWPTIRQSIKNFVEVWQGPLLLDTTGVGDPVFDELRREGVNVAPYVFTNESKQRLIVALMSAMDKKQISYPKDETLLAELEAFAYEQLPSGKFRYSAPDGMHDDCVIALALTNWARQMMRNTGSLEWVA